MQVLRGVTSNLKFGDVKRQMDIRLTYCILNCANLNAPNTNPFRMWCTVLI